jgi:uncharacterized cofD-like protein
MASLLPATASAASPQRRVRIVRQASWLLPGLSIKRWIGMSLAGAFLLLLGLAMYLNLHPIAYTIELFRTLAPLIPPHISGPLLILTGILCLLVGSRNTYASVFTAMRPVGGEANDLLETLMRQRKLERGPRIVVIGGGTGLSTLLRGLKHYTTNLTAVVTVGDDGGSSGRLREEQGIIPPGDIRNCIAALADEEHLITSLFQYRFKTGQGLEGHSFGNLFLTAMCRVTGDMMSAIKESSKVLNIRGRVLPSSLDNVQLVADMEDGRQVHGESQIPEAHGRIRRLRCEPEHPTVLPDVLAAIENAELIVMGPGSLYTSVLPNLVMRPIAQAVAKSRAPKVYIANIMTQPGETDGFSVGDHLQAILDHTQQPGLIQGVVVNNWLPEALLAHYRQYGYEAVHLDSARCQGLGVQVIQTLLVDDTDEKTIRHNPRRLARAVLHWYKREARRRQRQTGGQPAVEVDSSMPYGAETALSSRP